MGGATHAADESNAHGGPVYLDLGYRASPWAAVSAEVSILLDSGCMALAEGADAFGAAPAVVVFEVVLTKRPQCGLLS